MSYLFLSCTEKKIEKITKEQDIEFEEYVQNALIKLINQCELTTDLP